MSSSRHKSDLIVLAVMGAFAGVVVLAIVVAGWIQGARTGRWLRTTHSTNVEGTIVCYTLLDRLGFDLQRFEHATLPETLADVDVLFMIDPVVTLTGIETAAVEAWVRAGGVLVCTPSPFALWNLHQMRCEAGEAYHRAKPGVRPVRTTRETTKVPRRERQGELERDVHEVMFSSPRTLAPEVEDLPHDAEPMQELLADSLGVRVASRETGSGLVVCLSDSSFLANGVVGEGDNAILVANLAAYAEAHAHGGRLAFDEYHLGFGEHETATGLLSAQLMRTPAGWALLCMGAAGVLFLVYRGRRFGTRRAPPRSRRRSKLEFVRSVGATYAAAGAHRLTFRLIFAWFRRRCAGTVGLPASVSTPDLCAALARRTGSATERYTTVLGGCEAALASGDWSARRATGLLRELARVESEIHHGHTGRQ